MRGNPAFNLDGTTLHDLGTWVEVAWDPPPSRRSYGDISLLQGCDGAVLLAATDGTGVVTGFSQDIVDGAPPGALAQKSSGAMALAGTDGNVEAREYEMGILSSLTQAFIVEGDKPVISSANGRWEITFFAGGY